MSAAYFHNMKQYPIALLLFPPKCRPKSSHGTYLIPENFQQRNIQLIQSIKEFLQSDESKFNKFKTHSGQFRQVSGKNLCVPEILLCSVHIVPLFVGGEWTRCTCSFLTLCSTVALLEH